MSDAMKMFPVEKPEETPSGENRLLVFVAAEPPVAPVVPKRVRGRRLRSLAIARTFIGWLRRATGRGVRWFRAPTHNHTPTLLSAMTMVTRHHHISMPRAATVAIIVLAATKGSSAR